MLDVASGPLPAYTIDRPLLLVNLLQLRRAAAGRGWRVYREDLGGFVVGWLMVLALVALTALLLGSVNRSWQASRGSVGRKLDNTANIR